MWKSYHHGNLGREQASHRVSDEDDISRFGLVRLQPLAKVVTSHIDGLVRLVAGVDFGVYDVRLGEGFFEVIVNVSGERAKGRLVTVEAVDVDDEQGSAGDAVAVLCGWGKRVSR